MVALVHDVPFVEYAPYGEDEATAENVEPPTATACQSAAAPGMVREVQDVPLVLEPADVLVPFSEITTKMELVAATSDGDLVNGYVMDDQVVGVTLGGARCPDI